MGLVQGVGFRPFIKRLAAQRRLSGWVKNSGGAVVAEIEGPEAACRAALDDLREQAPTNSDVRSIQVEEVAPGQQWTDFIVLPSESNDHEHRFIPVDIGICPTCREELLESLDRRHQYPFINCCHCGPRYSIIRDLPYDRERTSMRSFHFCLDCRFEYEHEADRRYHAEPNACEVCGPRYTYKDHSGLIIGETAIEKAANLLEAGKILAIKGVGGFHLACAADIPQAVERLRLEKARPEKPLAIMVADLDEAMDLGDVGPAEAELLQGPQRPIVLLRSAQQRGMIATNVSPGLGTIGVMLPYAPVQIMLLQKVKRPLVYTSANKNGETLIVDNQEALSELADVADAWLLHDRAILNRSDDSIVRHSDTRTVTIRAGRGSAPSSTYLPGRFSPILALGGDLKSSVCLAKNGWAHVSPHLGDLEEASCFERYRETIDSMRRLLRIEPKLVTCDRHPDYISTQYAGSLGLPIVSVQHHHAHVAAVMAEHSLNEPVIGVAFDGMGWGDDGTVWGGEWFVCDRRDYRRLAHLREVRLPGGDAAARNPWRSAVSYLHALGLTDREMHELIPSIDLTSISDVRRQVESGINAPLTSSCGRLFEAVAAVACGASSQTYEGQAAAQLEGAANREVIQSPYDLDVVMTEGGPIEVDAAPAWQAIVDDIRAGATPGHISARFHDGLARATALVCEQLKDAHGVNDVVLAGGVFVNARLLGKTTSGLEEIGLNVHTPRNFPVNDGGLSLGQAAIAAARGTEEAS